MLAIGFKGGVEIAHNVHGGFVFATTLVVVALSFTLPFPAYALLRATTRLDVPNAAAIAAHAQRCLQGLHRLPVSGHRGRNHLSISSPNASAASQELETRFCLLLAVRK